MAINVGDMVRLKTTSVPATRGIVRDTYTECDGTVSYLVEWGSPAYGAPARIWTTEVA